MGLLVFISACVGPLVLACGVVVAALSLFAESLSLSTIAVCLMLVASAPMVAACTASTLYRWCFPSGSALLVMNAAGLLAMLALLSDEHVLTTCAHFSAFSVPPSPARVVEIVSVASVAGVLSSSVVMLAVLTFEIPARWFLSKSGAREWEGILRALRLVGTAVVLVMGWGLIDEFARARLSAVLSFFS